MTTWTNNLSLSTLLEWVVQVDIDELSASIAADRAEQPGVTDAELIDQAFNKARRKTTLTALATGLPANPWVAVPAATLDVAMTLRTEIQAVARAALIHDPAFFDDEAAAWTLLVPVFGIGASSQFARSLGVAGTHHVTRALLQRYMAREGLRSFKRLMLRYFGLRVTRRGVITKSVPLVGAALGAGWNYVEMAGIRSRTRTFLDQRAFQRRLNPPGAPKRLEWSAPAEPV
ncbi:hypothetical protein [Salinisphaera japonica]|uniref:Uncharacterized protein n=1 Tax=Salinisphaera japonica YTM-1 TaxID=1209778 RepID=A0A423PZE9_9GAMM|nr:hypothetical protein [Salinisphaera japonica]ROO30985.1 hypothetical protein SAJA_03910 [Salinisphaera japonica YTM-1]